METEIKSGLSEMGHKNLSPKEELELREIARQAGSTKP
jgi:hypothetical protein